MDNQNNQNTQNNQNEDQLSALAMNTNKFVPEPKPDAKRITALVKESGRVTGYQLDDGKTLAKDEAINLAKQGGIQGVAVATNQGNEYLRALPDGKENNNLGSLPSVSPKDSKEG